jgi:hypothetical protein
MCGSLVEGSRYAWIVYSARIWARPAWDCTTDPGLFRDTMALYDHSMDVPTLSRAETDVRLRGEKEALDRSAEQDKDDQAMHGAESPSVPHRGPHDDVRVSTSCTAQIILQREGLRARMRNASRPFRG